MFCPECPPDLESVVVVHTPNARFITDDDGTMFVMENLTDGVRLVCAEGHAVTDEVRVEQALKLLDALDLFLWDNTEPLEELAGLDRTTGRASQGEAQ